jgi:hypothetical protein
MTSTSGDITQRLPFCILLLIWYVDKKNKYACTINASACTVRRAWRHVQKYFFFILFHHRNMPMILNVLFAARNSEQNCEIKYVSRLNFNFYIFPNTTRTHTIHAYNTHSNTHVPPNLTLTFSYPRLFQHLQAKQELNTFFTTTVLSPSDKDTNTQRYKTLIMTKLLEICTYLDLLSVFLADGRSRETVAFRSGPITHSRRDLTENRNC